MSRIVTFPFSARRSQFSRRRRIVAWALVVAVAALAAAARARAQSTNAAAFDVHPAVGALLGIGDMHDAFKSAVVVGAQASWAFHPSFALVGSFAYSPSQDKLSVARPKLDIYEYDLGIKGRLEDLTSGSVISTRPYAIIGGGARTYDYRNLAGTSAQTNPLGFGAIGLDLSEAGGPFGLRLEARDNLTAFKGFRGELADRKARNDIQLSAGVTVAF